MAKEPQHLKSRLAIARVQNRLSWQVALESRPECIAYRVITGRGLNLSEPW